MTLDQLARFQILDGFFGSEGGNSSFFQEQSESLGVHLHPGWLSPEDSGLVNELLQKAQGVLDEGDVAYLNAEDLLQYALAGLGRNGNACQKMFRVAGDFATPAMFRAKPRQWAYLKSPLGKWFVRKAISDANLVRLRQQANLPEVAPGERQMSFITFLMWCLDQQTSEAHSLYALLDDSLPPTAPRDFLDRYFGLGHYGEQLNKDMARSYGVHPMTVSRWIRLMWTSAQKRVTPELRAELERAYEKYLALAV